MWWLMSPIPELARKGQQDLQIEVNFSHSEFQDIQNYINRSYLKSKGSQVSVMFNACNTRAWVTEEWISKLRLS